MNRRLVPVLALVVGFGIGWVVHNPRPQTRAEQDRSRIVVNYPNPDPNEPGKPRLTRELQVCRMADDAGEHDLASSTDQGQCWVIAIDRKTYRAVEVK